MARFLQADRVSRRWSNIVRTWLALGQQRRRRSSANASPAAPVITGHTLSESDGQPLYWFDVFLDFTFEQGRLPDAVIEVYWARQSQGWATNYVGSVASTERSFQHVRAFSDFEGDDLVRYTMRYRSGDDIIGPFSPEYQFIYVAP